MGKGDIKTAKGKRTRGSYGNTRKSNKSKRKSIAIIEKEKKSKAEDVKEDKKVPVKKKTTKKTVADDKTVTETKKTTIAKKTTDKKE